MTEVTGQVAETSPPYSQSHPPKYLNTITRANCDHLLDSATDEFSGGMKIHVKLTGEL